MGVCWILFTFCLLLFLEGIYGLDPEIKADLTKPNRKFGWKTINHFIELVNMKMPQFKMIPITDGKKQNPENARIPVNNVFTRESINIVQRYAKFDTTKNDVQIIPNKFIKDDAPIYIVTEYSAKTKSARIFDSLEGFNLTELQRPIMKYRYGEDRWYFQYPFTRNVEDASNGPLAIAYATLLIHGKDVRLYPLPMDESSVDPTMTLRRHILGMFESGNLTIFPKANFDEFLSSQIIKELSSADEPFSDVTINYFIEIIRNTTNFNMIDLAHHSSLDAYKKIDDPNEMDVQILYGDSSSNPNGYYICIFYDGQNSKKVFIYDVLMKKLSARNSEIIGKRYPGNKGIVYAKPSKEQKEKTKKHMDEITNGNLMEKMKLKMIANKTEKEKKARISSGAMSIAFAETLVRRRNRINNILLDKILLDEVVDDQYDLRKNILYLFRMKKSFDNVASKYISNRPPPKDFSQSNCFGGSLGPAPLLLCCLLGAQ